MHAAFRGRPDATNAAGKCAASVPPEVAAALELVPAQTTAATALP